MRELQSPEKPYSYPYPQTRQNVLIVLRDYERQQKLINKAEAASGK